MKIKCLNQTELNNALPFVWDVFCEYEEVNYPDSGKQAFWNAIHSKEYIQMLSAYGAYENEKLIGIIATRNAGSHIALFFVDGHYHHQGVGRSLWNAVLEDSAVNEITVHSSLYAVEVYKKLGFVQSDEVQEDGGIQYIPMVYKALIYGLQSKDDKKAYALSKEIGAKSAASDEYYAYFEDFAGLLDVKSSYVRTRGFVLCCAQARWDSENRLQRTFPKMFVLLHDDKPTVVRQCLGALHEVALYRPELCGAIKEELERIDLSKYKDSMAPLIQKDMNELLKMLD